MNKLILKAVFAGLVMGFAAASQAELFDRGNGLIYDNVLNITWLQNANLAADVDFDVAGVQPGGTMDYATAQAYIDAMNATHYKGFGNWRLPWILPQEGGVYNLGLEVDGSSDYGYNIGLPGTVYEGSMQSEFAHLHFATLLNESIFDTQGAPNPDCDPDCVLTSSPFFNIQVEIDEGDDGYWSGNPAGGDTDNIMSFHFGCGAQCHTDPEEHALFVWPVRDGDSYSRPVPSISAWAAWLLFGLLLATGAVLLRQRSGA